MPSTDSIRLDGKVALVTGGGAGIGGGITRVLGRAGATVVVNDIEQSYAEEAAAAVAAEGGKTVLAVGDIRDADVVARVCDTALEAGGGAVDVLVNNVGDFKPAIRSFLESDERQWDALYAINLQHVLRVTHRLLQPMIDRGGGTIVNVSTVEAIRGIPRHSVYSAFNAGVIGFTKSLAVEVGRYNIRVNAIAPDMANTLATPAESMLRGRDPSMVPLWIPVGHFGEPDDYGEVVLFLASDQSRFVTGHTIPVDGGTMAASGWYRRTGGEGFTNLPDNP
jgi:NAD(P)-dependent dehydrogenase (short-subunit alcohol dehydrogenase family)